MYIFMSTIQLKIEDMIRIILCVTLIIENIFGSLSNSKSKGIAHVLLAEGSRKRLKKLRKR